MASAPPDFAKATSNPRLMEAALALHDNRLSDAEPLLRAHLKADPFDVAAVRMLAELAGRIGRMADAETLLRRALELSPGFGAARANLATVLYRTNRAGEAIAELDQLARADPGHEGYANLRAAALGQIGEYGEALSLYEQVLERFPDQPKLWMSYGHTLKTVGRQGDGIAAYRRALDVAPGLGEVWWSLANLKTVRFDDSDLAAMESQVARDDVSDDDRLHLHFALGKAYEDAAQYALSFSHYADGNRIRAAQNGYDPDDTSAHVDRCIALFTPDYFAAREGEGCDAPDPVFILGMPRAGSTLIEQILASHSQVEGTMELPDIPALFAGLGGGASWSDRLAVMSGEERRALGADFLRRTQIQRKSGKPFFIDKLPNNWMQIGFILSILPNARIIDARRDPMDCCFSNFKQHFAKGQGFSYTLDGLGRYYHDYVRLMDHFDAALPGRIVRVIHEDLLDDPDRGIRGLLAALDLPFEADCLSFHENDRAVRTASSEQVRRPINRDGVGLWRPYEEWLGPLRDALGDLAI